MSEKEVIQVRTDCAFREMALYGKHQYDTLKRQTLSSYTKQGNKGLALKPTIPTYEVARKDLFAHWNCCDYHPTASRGLATTKIF